MLNDQDIKTFNIQHSIARELLLVSFWETTKNRKDKTNNTSYY
jgi:hypothetical protein